MGRPFFGKLASRREKALAMNIEQQHFSLYVTFMTGLFKCSGLVNAVINYFEMLYCKVGF
jgi:hypothetical protein